MILKISGWDNKKIKPVLKGLIYENNKINIMSISQEEFDKKINYSI